MNCIHESFFDAEGVIQYLCHWSKAVSSTRCIGYKVHVRSVIFVVDSHYKHWSGILAWCRHNDFLSTTLKVRSSLFFGKKYTSRFDNIVNSNTSPRDVFGCHFTENSDLFSIDNKSVFLVFDCSIESPMDGIVLEHILHVFTWNERIVDSNDSHIRILKRLAHHEASDAPKSINSDFNAHFFSILYFLSTKCLCLTMPCSCEIWICNRSKS
mmetsp:Transcript_17950/g.26894  ORF Transcript_17950/g.26894 Transcript_17950/m.26894 type:complete len:211 (-) Transcript_17950:6-638(-)